MKTDGYIRLLSYPFRNGKALFFAWGARGRKFESCRPDQLLTYDKGSGLYPCLYRNSSHLAPVSIPDASYLALR
jgi:hypothetical protein